MYRVAWRVALLIADNSPATATNAAGDGRSGAKVAAWLLAPAVLALEVCD
jgi:hypothetical protein